MNVHIRVFGPLGGALGPGRAALLQHIAETGSIREAAQRMQMSYNRAWTLVRSTNDSFQKPLVVASRGGDQHGCAVLTEEGRRVLEVFRDMESNATQALEDGWAEIRGRLK